MGWRGKGRGLANMRCVKAVQNALKGLQTGICFVMPVYREMVVEGCWRIAEFGKLRFLAAVKKLKPPCQSQRLPIDIKDTDIEQRHENT